MKTICIIKDGRPFWEEITEYLKAVNARVFPMTDKFDLQSILEKSPDIVITGERAYKEISALSQNMPKLIITEGGSAESKSKDVYFINWPAGEEAFLEMTSRLLYISERRLFKTVISITMRGKNNVFMGRSLNFSMSGMAFKSDRPLNSGDILTISFFIPGSDERLSVDAVVMRSSIDPDGGAVYYGARFFGIGKDIRNALERFIKKIK